MLARLLREHGVAPDVVLASPLPRAVQTAELLATSLDYLGTVTALRCLEPAAQPRVAGNAILSCDAGNHRAIERRSIVRVPALAAR